MKTKKAILGLSLCLGMMLSMGSLQKHTQANIGWGVAALCDASDDATAGCIVGGMGVGVTGALGAMALGAETGAKIGMWGGVAGVAAGVVIGGL